MITNRDMIEEKDLIKIKNIAEKYDMSIEEFGELISKKKDNYITKQIRFSKEEIAELDKKIESLNINRSEYIMRCIEKALSEKYYMQMDIKALKIGTYKCDCVRNVRIGIYFKNPDLCKKVEEIAKKFSLCFSTLIRTFALNIEL